MLAARVVAGTARAASSAAASAAARRGLDGPVRRRGPTGQAFERQQKRFWVIAGGMTCVGLATYVLLRQLEDSLMFYYTPSEILGDKRADAESRVCRLGGLVVEGSVVRRRTIVDFEVTDLAAEVPVRYEGLLPDLFKEGQSVVVQGKLAGPLFEATEVLAKHDEKYMPKEIRAAVERNIEAGERDSDAAAKNVQG